MDLSILYQKQNLADKNIALEFICPQSFETLLVRKAVIICYMNCSMGYCMMGQIAFDVQLHGHPRVK